MLFSVRKNIFLFTIFASVCNISKSDNTTAVVADKSKKIDTLTNSYNELLEDARWFFQRLEVFSSTAERILPNVSLDEQTRSLSPSAKLNFLVGLRHLFTGIKELSITFRKSIEAENVRQFQYVIQATNTLHEAFITLKIWFGSLRSLFGKIFRIYKRHIPEVLFGKCLGKYIIWAYPERSFYEYPFLLLSDIYTTIFKQVNETEKVSTESTAIDIGEITDIAAAATENISIEQNEILDSDQDDYKMAIRGRSLKDDSGIDNEDYLMSFFNFNDILEVDKENSKEGADEQQQSWQKCFKMYTAETIVRKLQVYFLENE